MESGSTSYCVYAPGNISPSRPPLRRAAPEHARSGFPFLIGMAALVLAVGIGSVARFCPQDLRFESGGKHPAKGTTTTTAAIVADGQPLAPAAVGPVITPVTFTTIGAPAPAPTIVTTPPVPAAAAAPVTTTARKKPSHAPRTRAGTAPSASASGAAGAGPALPENPYPEASPPDTYGF